MPKEIRTVSYDGQLKIEAYRFKGIMQEFPNHFHDYYVIGFIENGQRYLLCKNQEYTITPGDITLFNPGDTHTCKQVDGKTLDYRCINIQPDIMKKITYEVTGREYLPNFTQVVLYHNELATSLSELFFMISKEQTDFKKEELFLFLMSQLIQEYSEATYTNPVDQSTSKIKTVCDYLEANYAKTITLDHLSSLVGLSKYHFLRSFTSQKGISPYCYLETIRIGNAKKLLNQGIAPVDVAFQTGFSDQSHFSNFFKKFIGLTPRQYMRIFCDRSSALQLKEKVES